MFLRESCLSLCYLVFTCILYCFSLFSSLFLLFIVYILTVLYVDFIKSMCLLFIFVTLFIYISACIFFYFSTENKLFIIIIIIPPSTINGWLISHSCEGYWDLMMTLSNNGFPPRKQHGGQTQNQLSAS